MDDIGAYLLLGAICVPMIVMVLVDLVWWLRGRK